MKIEILLLLTTTLLLTTARRPARGGQNSFHSFVNLTGAEDKFAKLLHNYYRCHVTPTATNMLEIGNDEVLKRDAVNFVRKCSYKHRSAAKRRDENNKIVSENLYATNKKLNTTQLLQDAIKIWFEEGRNFDHGALKCRVGKECGHYQVMVEARANKVGCAISRCRLLEIDGKKTKNAVLLACMYHPHGLREGTRPYNAGASCSDALCGESRCVCKNEYDELYNKTMLYGVESLNDDAATKVAFTTVPANATAKKVQTETPAKKFSKTIENATKISTDVSTTRTENESTTLRTKAVTAGEISTADKTSKPATEQISTSQESSEKPKTKVIIEVTTARESTKNKETTKKSVPEATTAGSGSFYSVNCAFYFVVLLCFLQVFAF